MAGQGIDHGSRAHALLSASSAYRWLACTPSARQEDKFTEDETSKFAEEGTHAHEVSEAEILYRVGRIGRAEYLHLKKKLAESEYNTEENLEEVEKYVARVLDAWDDAKKVDRFAEIIIEDKMDLGQWVPQGFGTNDIVIIAGLRLTVMDLKFGRGLRVSAKDNPQLKLYALGALSKHGINHWVEEVTLVIDQPRLDNVSTFEISAKDLEAWGDGVVIPLAKKAFAGEGNYVPGKHCQFCKVAPRCKALAESVLDVAKHEFEDPDLLKDAELVDIFSKLDILKSWSGKVSSYMLNEAIGGKTWPGLKLIEGRSTRKITNEEKVTKVLIELGKKQEDYLNSKLKGIGDLTKLVGKAGFEKEIGPFVEKPKGAPNLTTADDPRKAYNSADQHKKDFE